LLDDNSGIGPRLPLGWQRGDNARWEPAEAGSPAYHNVPQPSIFGASARNRQRSRLGDQRLDCEIVLRRRNAIDDLDLERAGNAPDVGG